MRQFLVRGGRGNLIAASTMLQSRNGGSSSTGSALLFSSPTTASLLLRRFLGSEGVATTAFSAASTVQRRKASSAGSVVEEGGDEDAASAATRTLEEEDTVVGHGGDDPSAAEAEEQLILDAVSGKKGIDAGSVTKGAAGGGHRQIKSRKTKEKFHMNLEGVRNLIVRTLLSRFDGTALPKKQTSSPQKKTHGGSSGTTNAAADVSTQLSAAKLSALQLKLSQKWGVTTKPLDSTSNEKLLRTLGQYVLGDARLPVEVPAELDDVFVKRLGGDAFTSMEDPKQMRQLLEAVGYVKPRDNLNRVVSALKITLPPEAHNHARDFGDSVEVDPYDPIREDTRHSVYAIDSASTSEVDDAIGIHVDEKTGEQWVTVFVSDATVYCPYDSELEKSSARQLATTTYLPEGVYFMLPKQTVEAATLREDRPCRTFEARFRMDPTTGEILDYYVTVGWCHKLRRITYDAAQALYDHKQQVELRGEQYSPTMLSDTPSWATKTDIDNLHRILHLSRVRINTRKDVHGGVAANLPQPLITVKDLDVVSVEDQILCTIDARIAVAEMMIAANEVCSRVAQEVEQPIPFRGSRPLSPMHEASVEYLPPPGFQNITQGGVDSPSESGNNSSSNDSVKNANDSGGGALGQAIFKEMENLRGVTRAVYSHEPLFHNGLATGNYCHSTSPLRRYADMLVHHQLKTAIGRENGIRAQEFIPSFEMATTCAGISQINNRNRIMQIKSSRFWVLRHLMDNLMAKAGANDRFPDGGLKLVCLVGRTAEVDHCAEVRQTAKSLSHLFLGSKFETLLKSPKGTQRKPRKYTSDIYIPKLQLTHTILHNRQDVVMNSVLTCKIKKVDPELDVLDLEIRHVGQGDGPGAAELLVALGAGDE